MIEYAARAKKLPAPPHVVWDSLVYPHQPKARPWLVLLDGEIEPRVVDSAESERVLWSSPWPSRPDDRVHIELAAVDGQTSVRFRLLTPSEAPSESTARTSGDGSVASSSGISATLTTSERIARVAAGLCRRPSK